MFPSWIEWLIKLSHCFQYVLTVFLNSSMCSHSVFLDISISCCVFAYFNIFLLCVCTFQYVLAVFLHISMCSHCVSEGVHYSNLGCFKAGYGNRGPNFHGPKMQHYDMTHKKCREFCDRQVSAYSSKVTGLYSQNFFYIFSLH